MQQSRQDAGSSVMGGGAGAEPWTGQQGDLRKNGRGKRGEAQGDSQIWGLDDWTPRKILTSTSSFLFHSFRL